MKKIMEIEMKIEKLLFERELLNRRIEQYEGAGMNWKMANRSVKITLLKKLNSVEKKLNRWKVVKRELTKYYKKTGVI